MKKPVNVDLQQLSDVALLESVVEITLHTGPMTPKDREELDIINQEFIRRDSLTYLPRGR
jgi:hypothetical protein